MRLTILFVCVIALSSAAMAQSGEFEISEIDTKSKIITGKMKGEFRAMRLRLGAPITINGVKATFAELEPGMKANILSSDPGIVSSITAIGVRTKQPPLGQAQQVRHFVATVPANSPDAFLIGDVRKGSTISIRYRSGKWKSFGRFASYSPDEENPENWDACRLSVALPSKNGKAGQSLALLPTNTRSRPFVFVAPTDYPALVLRINDSDKDYASNPGSVEYSVTVTPPGR